MTPLPLVEAADELLRFLSAPAVLELLLSRDSAPAMRIPRAARTQPIGSMHAVVSWTIAA